MRALFFILFLGLLFNCSNVFSQINTMGLLEKKDNIVDGYTLFSPENATSSYLINNCGEKVKEWTFTDRPGLTAYLLENGNILRAGVNSIEIRDWNDNLVWFYPMNANGYNQHHDIEPLPNGNVLCLLSVFYSSDTIISLGRDSSITGSSFKLDKIIELEPIGTNDANLVWEWGFIDHIVQEADPLKPNYNDVSLHPELLNINYDGGKNVDFTHANGIDYNADLDQILISARHTNEIYIIDHSTTTAEATSHSGGDSGKGGDFLWRWGNPQVYNQTSVQLLHLQHDAKWIEPGYMDEGKISVFNNQGDGTTPFFSSIHIVEPELSGNSYNLMGGTFLPTNFFWSWNGSFFGNLFYESKKSGCQMLENGNAIICETNFGRFTEINRAGEMLWSYRNPIGTGTVFNQNETNTNGDNSLFRAEKYPADYPAFIGKDLISLGIIENENMLSDSCDIISGIQYIVEKNKPLILNPIINKTIHFSKNQRSINIKILNLQGQIVFHKENFSGKSLTFNQNINPATYFLMLGKDHKIMYSKILIY